MKQLKLDQYVVRGGNILEANSTPWHQQTQGRSVLQAFSEYEDVSQNVYIYRSRNHPLDDDIPYCGCYQFPDWGFVIRKMKQLKLDQYVVRGGNILEANSTPWHQQTQGRSVLQAFSEYEDVSQNVYIYRSRNHPLDDDIPYCGCYQFPDWGLTCLLACENRATQTECVVGHCTTRYRCSNQRMQRGDHASLEIQSVPGKGIALIAEMAIEKDELVAQYVGEVLSLEMYLDRESKVTSSKHTYGMAVSATEVIDARNVGGIARFANHSCAPNCLVESR